MVFAKLTFEDKEAKLDVETFTVHETMSSLFRISVLVTSSDASVDLGKYVGKAAALEVDSGYAFAKGRSRRAWSGLCVNMVQIQAEQTGLSRYQLSIVPRLWVLSQRRNYRIFQDLSAVAIVKKILAEWKLKGSWHVNDKLLPSLDYKVQYGESDYAFLCRLLEEVGICFSFVDSKETASALHFWDAPQSNEARKAAIWYSQVANDSAERESMSDMQVGLEVRSGALTLADHDFRQPRRRLLHEAKKEKKPEDGYALLGYRPGHSLVRKDGKDRHDEAYGKLLAQRWLEALRSGRETVRFDTNAVDLRPGTVCAIDDAPPQIGSRKLLVLSLHLQGGKDRAWDVGGEAVFADAPFRPPRVNIKPEVRAVQSAVVVGPKGKEIHCDEYGRVRVQFPWDRYGKANEQSSCWLRVASGWAGSGFGMMQLPRIGQEVLVSFLEGDPERPVVTSRVFNQLNPVPYKLPKNKTISGYRSQSTPAGSGFNALYFDDAKSKERVFVQAQKDLRQWIKNDDVGTVSHDRHKLVKGSEEETVLGNREQVTEGNRSQLAKQQHNQWVGGGHSVLVKKNEERRNDDHVALLIGKDGELVVGKDLKAKIEGSLHVDSRGDQAERVGKGHSRTVGGDLQQQIGGKYALDAGSDVHLKAGTKVVLAAGADVTLKGPGGHVRITAAGVEIEGKPLVLINSGGSPGSGGGAQPKKPKEPKEAKLKAPAIDPDKVLAKSIEGHAKADPNRLAQTKKTPKLDVQGKDGTPPTPDKKKTHWIRFKVVDDASGKPVPGLRLVVTRPDGTKATSTSDDKGLIELKKLRPGTCNLASAFDPSRHTVEDTLAHAVGKQPPKPKHPMTPAGLALEGKTWTLAVVTHRKVKTDETLQSIASEEGLKESDIRYFNFGSHDKKAVDEAMYHRLGCRYEDKDGYLLLDDRDDPGILYLPRPFSQKGLAVDKEHTLRVRALPLPTPTVSIIFYMSQEDLANENYPRWTLQATDGSYTKVKTPKDDIDKTDDFLEIVFNSMPVNKRYNLLVSNDDKHEEVLMRDATVLELRDKRDVGGYRMDGLELFTLLGLDDDGGSSDQGGKS